MSKTLQRIRELVDSGEVRISDHGYDELAEDGIFAREVIAGVGEAILIEDYPDYPKGPCVLLRKKDKDGQPIHVVWGIPRNADAPAVMVTAYRPNADKWTNDFLKRKQ